MSGRDIFLKTKRYHLVVLSAVLALLSLGTPIQQFVSIGRYQHYAIAIGLFSLGYIAQALYSWKEIGRWARISYFATGFFFMSVSVIFYLNPWLDYKVAVPTEEHDRFRNLLVAVYLVLSLALTCVWLKLAHEDNKARQREKLMAAGKAMLDANKT
ncbi:MAG TPA: hypothetical protein V6D17_01930 [Candidatus Obscuribacterales bacterium]